MKYKYIILSSLITFIVIILVNLIIISFNSNDLIKVKSIDNYYSIKNQLTKRIDKIKNDDCQESLNSMLTRIDDTYFIDSITKEEYYKAYFKDDITFLNYFDDVVNKCDIRAKDRDYIYISALSSMNYPNKIKEDYNLRYEFRIKDNYSRKYFKDDDLVGTYTTKSLELKVLDELIDEVEK